MTVLFIDCEFDDPANKLISMAIVSEDGMREFYEVVEYDKPTDDWVLHNVIPILDKKPIPYDAFQAKLAAFCGQFPGMTIISDHVNDMRYFTASLDYGSGKRIRIQPLILQVEDDLSAKRSKKLHNALFDARAVRDDYRKREGLDPIPFG